MTSERSEAIVLLISDDPVTRDGVSAALCGAGYAVTQASPQEARACALELPVDAVIVDLSPPEAALEMERQLRADCLAAIVPTLRLTSADEEALPLAQRLAASATIFLAKPVRPAVLISTVSTLVRMGRAYRQAEQARVYLEEVLGQMPSGVIVADAEGELQMTNERAKEILCLEEIPGPLAAQMSALRPTVRGILASVEGWPLWRALHRGERVVGEEFEVSCGDGRRIVVRVSAGPIRDAERAIVAGVVSLTDVTEQKRAEQERERLREDADRQRRRLEAVQENVPVGIASLDRDYRIQSANSAAGRLAGLPREELLGRRFFDLFPDPQVEALFEAARTTGEPVYGEEIPFVFRDQPERGVIYWSGALVPLRDGTGEVTGLVLTLWEVTERVHQREQVVAAERARAELAEALNVEVNHRVKNNLAMAAGMLHMQSTAEHDPRLAASLEDAAARLSTLASIHDQLQVSREGRVNLLSLVRRVLDAIHDLLTARGIEFVLEGEPLEVAPRTATNLAIVANELITNAVKYCEPVTGASCAVRVDLRVTLGVREGRLMLSVWNSGNPVAEDFDVEREGKMGLRLVRALIVEQYGGTFSLRPYEGGTLAEVAVDMAVISSEW